jgi:hypothetical protein
MGWPPVLLRRRASRSTRQQRMDERAAADRLYPVAVRNVQAAPIDPPLAAEGPSATSALTSIGDETSHGRAGY